MTTATTFFSGQHIPHSLYVFLFNTVQSDMMSDTGFTCPKCDHSFPTAEQVAEHLKNEHADGAQTESTKRIT
jgi:thiol-disulfide isomerase/thioredoxin